MVWDFNKANIYFDGEDGTVRSHGLDLDALAQNWAFSGAQVMPEATLVSVSIGRRNYHAAHDLSHDLITRPAKFHFRSLIEIYDPAFMIDCNDAVQAGIEHGLLA